ncbi:nucleoside/nucleotide kinase family protein [Microlunatus soli]|uniref:AAA domain-containing protein n=1 Tax=Microlunatus soli TaxID=630515 RepID=A0A1H1TQ92_9ACTN|nr:hypothetical protein [Microlunatus soli]SDS61729.1 hypothetical protein SAMN04489812_2463 [Microlunatus soli]
MITDADEFAIFLNGSYGAGKSSALDHIGDRLADAGRPFSLMDVDWYHRSWPPADHDQGNKIIEAENMAFVWANYKSAGPRQLIISGVIDSSEARERYARALGLTIRSVRLTASPTVTERRLRGRYTDAQATAFAWHETRHEELSTRLAEADLDEMIVDTDALTPQQVAQVVLAHFGYR